MLDFGRNLSGGSPASFPGPLQAYSCLCPASARMPLGTVCLTAGGSAMPSWYLLPLSEIQVSLPAFPHAFAVNHRVHNHATVTTSAIIGIIPPIQFFFNKGALESSVVPLFQRHSQKVISGAAGFLTFYFAGTALDRASPAPTGGSAWAEKASQPSTRLQLSRIRQGPGKGPI